MLEARRSILASAAPALLPGPGRRGWICPAPAPPPYAAPNTSPNLQLTNEVVQADARLAENTLERARNQVGMHRHRDPQTPRAIRTWEPVCLTIEKPSRPKSLSVAAPEMSRGSFMLEPGWDR